MYKVLSDMSSGISSSYLLFEIQKKGKWLTVMVTLHQC